MPESGSAGQILICSPAANGGWRSYAPLPAGLPAPFPRPRRAVFNRPAKLDPSIVHCPLSIIRFFSHPEQE